MLEDKKNQMRTDCVRIVFLQVTKAGYELIIIAAEQQVTMTVYFDIMQQYNRKRLKCFSSESQNLSEIYNV